MPDPAAELILAPEGPPTLTPEAARVLAGIIRAARDTTQSAPPQADVAAVADRQSVEGHSAA